MIVFASNEIPIEPEVRVRSVRRRRSEPPKPVVPPPPNVRSWMIYAGLTALTAALMLDGFLRHRPLHQRLPSYSEATEVRSSISERADTLQVVVSWELTLADPTGRPDSIRVRVAGNQQDSVVAFQSPTQFADTVYLPAPPPGQSLSGFSCASAAHPDQLLRESCTPWQYVRPTATAVAAASPNTIVIQPQGLQVDPDVGGRCAQWQRKHPEASVWIAVNRRAVPECTGPNQKPTVAQFCAFAVLPDGRRVKTMNSINNRYCDELFEEWTRERYS